MGLNNRIRAARIARGIKLQEMADSLHITLHTLQRYESGGRSPTFETLVKIADILDVPTDYLLGRDEFLKKNNFTIDIPKEMPPRRHTSKKNP